MDRGKAELASDTCGSHYQEVLLLRAVLGSMQSMWIIQPVFWNMPDHWFLSPSFSPTIWNFAWKLMQFKPSKTSEQTSPSPNFIISLHPFFSPFPCRWRNRSAEFTVSLNICMHFQKNVITVDSFYHIFLPPGQSPTVLSNAVLGS